MIKYTTVHDCNYEPKERVTKLNDNHIISSGGITIFRWEEGTDVSWLEELIKKNERVYDKEPGELEW